MRSVCIIGCAAHKRQKKLPAEQLYSSELFFKARRFAQANYDDWLILSAKHGLIRPNTLVAPYDKSVDDLNPQERARLSAKIKFQADELAGEPQGAVAFYSLCSKPYNSILKSSGLRVTELPEFELPIGKKLHALASATDPTGSEANVDKLYKTIAPLLTPERLTPLKDAINRDIPESGVYLFFDNNERRLRDISGLRIVRVGTHGVANGSKASLRDRTRTHFGTSSGDGNHRSSVFRLHIGRAILQQNPALSIPSWGSTSKPAENSKEERKLERAVSDYIGKLLITFVSIPGVSEKSNDRAYIEQNTIALLSNGLRPLDPASYNWIGKFSDKKEIRKSGLWNVNHTAQTLDDCYFDILSYYVAFTCGNKALPQKPKTPSDWEFRVRQDARQFNLL